MHYTDIDYYADLSDYLSEYEIAHLDAYQPDRIVESVAERKNYTLAQAKEYVDCIYERWDFVKVRPECQRS